MNSAAKTYISSEPSKIVTIDPSGNWKERLDVVEQLPRDIGEGGRDPISHRDGSVVKITSIGKLGISSGIIVKSLCVLLVRDNDLVVVLGHGESGFLKLNYPTPGESWRIMS